MNSSEFKLSVAIVVGINDYQNGIPPLGTARQDAEAIAELLERDHHYHVHLITESTATTEKLMQLLETEVRQAIATADPSRFLFYFAGHGIALNGDDGPEGYLILRNSRLGDVSTYLPMSKVYNAFIQLSCRHFLGILDCCFAGAFRWASTRKLVPIELGTIHKERFDRFIKDPAWQVITSAAYDQTALDNFDLKDDRGQKEGHSPFAAILIDALQGHADAYPPAEPGKPAGDGVLTATELYMYLRNRLEAETDARSVRQTPGICPLKKHDKGEYIFLTPGHELNLPPAPPLDVSSNPYRGLEAFGEANKDLFFGRKALTQQLVEFVATHSLTVVLGASGSGKSSLVKAGLIPTLRQQQDWYLLPPLRPGESPFKALNLAIASANLPDSSISPDHQVAQRGLLPFTQRLANWFKQNPQAHLLIVVDQLEELITLSQDEQERQQFFNLLAAAIASHPVQLHLVLTLRSDFEPQFRSTTLEQYWKAARFVVPAMTREELRQAIEEPASARVMYFTPHELVDQLIDEVANMPGALPLLSFALSELYLNYLERQKEAKTNGATLDRAMTQADYAAMGGVTQSLTQRADREYEALVQRDPEYAKTIQNVMLRLVVVGGGELARRRVPLSEFEYPPVQNERVKAVIQRFADVRLLVKGQDPDGKPYAEPAHDALVRGWQKLLAWKQEQEESLILQRRLTPAAEEWKDVATQTQSKGLLAKTEPVINGLDRGFYAIESLLSKASAQLVRLWQRSQPQQERSREQPGQFLWNTNPYLGVLNEQLQSNNHWFNQVEAEFVQESVLQRRKNTSWRWRTAIAVILGLSGLTIVALIGQRNIQIVQTTAARSSAEENFRANEQLNALVDSLRASRNIKQIFLPSNNLYNQVGQTLQNTFYSGKEKERWEAPPGIVFEMFFTSDRQLRVITNDNGIVQVWDKYGEPVAELQGQEGLYRNSISISPDGSKIATATKDGTVHLWDLQGNQLGEFEAHKCKITEQWQTCIDRISFSPDSSKIATAGISNDGENKSVRLWSLEGNKIKGFEFQSSVIGLGFNSSGELLVATGTDRIKVFNWAGEKPQELAAFDSDYGSAIEVSFSLDGKRAMFFYGEESENAALWNFLEESKPQSLNDQLDEGVSQGGSFSPDGKQLAVTGVNGSVNLSDSSGWNTFELPQGRVQMSTFSPDGSQLITLGGDNTIRFWNLDQQPLSKFKLAQSGIESLSFSSDGQTLATTDSEGKVRLLDLQGKQLREFVGLPKITSVSFSLNGQTLATTGEGGVVRLLDLHGKVVKEFQAHPGDVTSVNWSQDGQRIATVGDGGNNEPGTNKSIKNSSVRLWDTKGNLLGERKGSGISPFESVSFQSNGQPIMVAQEQEFSSTGNIYLLKFLGRPTNIIPGRQANNYFDFVNLSQDGNLLLTTSGNTIRLWNLKGKKLMEFSGNSEIKSLSLSSDNSVLAVIGTDGATELWRLGDFDELLSKGCDRVRDYLEHNPYISESDRHLCDR